MLVAVATSLAQGGCTGVFSPTHLLVRLQTAGSVRETEDVTDFCCQVCGVMWPATAATGDH